MSPLEVTKARGLVVVSDDGPLIAAIDEALVAHPDVLEKIRDGGAGIRGRDLCGDEGDGTADAGRVRELVLERAGQG